MIEDLGPYRLGPNETPENGIYTGDARELAVAIPDASVDMIFADPVYDRIDDYRWLAKMGARVLREGGNLVTFYGIGYAPEVLGALSEWLDYRWTLTGYYAGRKQFHGKLVVSMTIAAWMEKGKGKMFASVADNMTLAAVQRGRRYRQKNGASWDKHPKLVRRYVEGFCPPGGIVLDCYLGMGGVARGCKRGGRRYLGFEIDAAVAEMAREQVRLTQPRLFVMEPEQIAMGLAA